MKALELIRKIRTEKVGNSVCGILFCLNFISLKLQVVKISRAEIGHLKTYRDMFIQVRFAERRNKKTLQIDRCFPLLR